MDYNYERMQTIFELIEQLEQEHRLYNENVENYEEDGDEHFETWLTNIISKIR